MRSHASTKQTQTAKPGKHNKLQPHDMESVGSNSPTPYDPLQPITDRIIRALSHRLALLHRSGSHFYVLGSTANVYTVTVCESPACTCPDRTVPCKHILFVLLRVLQLPFDDAFVYRRTLRTCQLERILSAPTAPNVTASAKAIERFHQLVNENAETETRSRNASGEPCPVCLEGMGDEEGQDVVTCSTCENSVHQECFRKWRRSRGRRAGTCVVCRARWTERRAADKYLNLASYITGDDEERGWMSCER